MIPDHRTRTFAFEVTAADALETTSGGIQWMKTGYQRWKAKWVDADNKSHKLWIGCEENVEHGSYDGNRRQRRKKRWVVKVDGDEVGEADLLKDAKALAEAELGIVRAQPSPAAPADGAGAGVVDPVATLAPPDDGTPDPFALLRAQAFRVAAAGTAGGATYRAVEPITIGTTAGGTYTVGADETVTVRGPDQAGFYEVTPGGAGGGGQSYRVMSRIFDRAFTPIGGQAGGQSGGQSARPAAPPAAKRSPADIRGVPMHGPGRGAPAPRGTSPVAPGGPLSGGGRQLRPPAGQPPAAKPPIQRPAPLGKPRAPAAPGGGGGAGGLWSKLTGPFRRGYVEVSSADLPWAVEVTAEDAEA